MAPRGPLAAIVGAAVLTLQCALPIRGLVLRDRNSSRAAAANSSLVASKNHTAAASENHTARDRHLQSCLAGQRIVFIGPSTSKFDYIALAYFAEYGRWPIEDQVVISNGATGPNPLYEWNVRNALKAGQWLPPEIKTVNAVPGCIGGGGTETFMRYTNHIMNAHEVCDCHQNGNWKGVGDWYNSTENRVYLNGNTMVSYFQWFGDTVSPRGTIDMSPLLAPTTPQAVNLQCPVGQFPGKWAWTLPLTDFLNNVVKYTNPTHLIISAAFWPTKPEDTARWEALAQAGANAVSGSGGQVYWRTTPQRTDHAQTDPASSVDTSPFVRHGWKIYDARGIVSQFQGARNNDEIFYDFTHLRPAPASFLGQTWLQQNVCPAVAR